jgi:hypothetical protein
MRGTAIALLGDEHEMITADPHIAGWLQSRLVGRIRHVGWLCVWLMAKRSLEICFSQECRKVVSPAAHRPRS